MRHFPCVKSITTQMLHYLRGWQTEAVSLIFYLGLFTIWPLHNSIGLVITKDFKVLFFMEVQVVQQGHGQPATGYQSALMQLNAILLFQIFYG